MFQEYPKALYKGDSYRAVEDADQEAEARSQGWHDFGKAPEVPQTGSASQSADQAATDQEQTAAKTTGRGKKAKADHSMSISSTNSRSLKQLLIGVIRCWQMVYIRPTLVIRLWEATQ